MSMKCNTVSGHMGRYAGIARMKRLTGYRLGRPQPRLSTATAQATSHLDGDTGAQQWTVHSEGLGWEHIY